jgi:hypothetical protein
MCPTFKFEEVLDSARSLKSLNQEKRANKWSI